MALSTTIKRRETLRLLMVYKVLASLRADESWMPANKNDKPLRLTSPGKVNLKELEEHRTSYTRHARNYLSNPAVVELVSTLFELGVDRLNATYLTLHVGLVHQSAQRGL